MGWAGGSDLFDGAVRVALDHSPKVNTDEGAQTPAKIRKRIFSDMYALFHARSDWDTQDESDYFLTDLVHIMYELGELDEDEYQGYLSDS